MQSRRGRLREGVHAAARAEWIGVLCTFLWLALTGSAEGAPARVTLPPSAAAFRVNAEGGSTLVVSPEPGAAIAAACAPAADGVVSDELRREIARRGGDAIQVREGVLSIACVAAPAKEAAFALSIARRLGAKPQRGADDGAPEGASTRLVRLALEGTEPPDAAPAAPVVAFTGAVPRTALPPMDANGAAARPSPLPLKTRQSSERLSVVESPGPSPRTAYSWLVPNTTPEDAAALAVSLEVLAGPLKSRLPRLLVTDRSLARKALGERTRVRGATLASVFVESTTRTSVDRVRRFVDGTLKQLRLVGPTRGEVDRARARLMAEALATWEDPVRRAAALLAAEVLAGDALRFLDEARALARVEPESVRRTFADRFVDARRTTIEEYPPLWPADDARLAGYRLHTIEQNDTLENLARRFAVPLTSLARANDLDPKRALTPGQPLWIPPSRGGLAPAAR